MYKYKIKFSTQIKCNDTTEAISIEEQMRQVTASNEPIENTSALIYTERGDGVLPGYDIRTDRFEVAIDAADRITAAIEAQREKQMQTQQTTENKE